MNNTEGIMVRVTTGPAADPDAETGRGPGRRRVDGLGSRLADAVAVPVPVAVCGLRTRSLLADAAADPSPYGNNTVDPVVSLASSARWASAASANGKVCRTDTLTAPLRTTSKSSAAIDNSCSRVAA